MSKTNEVNDKEFKETHSSRARHNVLVLENVSTVAVEIFKNAGCNVVCSTALTEQQLAETLPDFQAVCVRSKTAISKSLLDASRHLLVIGAFCIGTEHIECEYAASRGIAVFNAPFANTRSVAEMVLGEMIMLSRQIGDRSNECHHGTWNKVSDSCHELRAKLVGIIGYGHVGSQLSILCEALGMRVIYYDVVPVMPLGNARSCASLEDVMRQADFVTLHVPGGPSTYHLIGEKEIALMKRTSYLVNASRGTVVYVDAVASALSQKRLAGAAFDVFPIEPESGKSDKFVSALQGQRNVILTPHIGGSTEEAQTAIGKEVAHKMVQYLTNGHTLGSVNVPSVSLPKNDKVHRIVNIHKNVPGMLKEINTVLSDYNVVAQMLLTTDAIGYLLIEVDRTVSGQVNSTLSKLPSSIRTRILY